MAVYLRKQGYKVNHKRVERLMKKNLSLDQFIHYKNNKKQTFTFKVNKLLKTFKIEKYNDTWFMSIIYVRVLGGFRCRVAVMDAYSKKSLTFLISWIQNV